mmetsp:Transcript_8928/g.14320  ORF Transcript_8928/g.14320 Transcript_8928/m.14320 type:complete len:92 (+) Transcript_8928:524-799(+)
MGQWRIQAASRNDPPPQNLPFHPSRKHRNKGPLASEKRFSTLSADRILHRFNLLRSFSSCASSVLGSATGRPLVLYDSQERVEIRQADHHG